VSLSGIAVGSLLGHSFRVIAFVLLRSCHWVYFSDFKGGNEKMAQKNPMTRTFRCVLYALPAMSVSFQHHCTGGFFIVCHSIEAQC